MTTPDLTTNTPVDAAFETLLDQLQMLSPMKKLRVIQVLTEDLIEDEEENMRPPQREEDMSEEKRQLLADLRQGIHDAFTGNTRPARELLAELEQELEEENADAG
jgi:hypothetical protein